MKLTTWYLNFKEGGIKFHKAIKDGTPLKLERHFRYQKVIYLIKKI